MAFKEPSREIGGVSSGESLGHFLKSEVYTPVIDSDGDEDNKTREQLHADMMFEEIMKEAEAAESSPYRYIDQVRFGVFLHRGDYASISEVLPLEVLSALDARLAEYLALNREEAAKQMGLSAMANANE